MSTNDSLTNEFELPLDQVVHDLAVAYVSKTTTPEVTPEQWVLLYKKAFEQIYCQFAPEND